MHCFNRERGSNFCMGKGGGSEKSEANVSLYLLRLHFNCFSILPLVSCFVV